MLLLHWRRSTSGGEQTCGRTEIEIRHEQPLLSIRLIALQRAVGADDRRRGAGTFASAVHRCEIAGVLRRATQHGFFVEGVGGVGEGERAITTGFGDMRVRVKHDLRAAADGPPNGFRIPPPFMTNHNTKGQRPGGEDPTSGPEHRIGSFLWRIESVSYTHLRAHETP